MRPSQADTHQRKRGNEFLLPVAPGINKPARACGNAAQYNRSNSLSGFQAANNNNKKKKPAAEDQLGGTCTRSFPPRGSWVRTLRRLIKLCFEKEKIKAWL